MESRGGCRVPTGVRASGAESLGIAPRDDFEAFRKTQAVVQGAGKVGSSRCESLMFHDREPIIL